MPDKNPWGNGQDQGPPDLIELIKKGFKKGANGSKFSTRLPTDNHTGFFAGIIALGLIILWALSGIFLVSPPEQAAILRFGKYVETVGPGPHWIPRFIESKDTVNVQQVRNFQYASEMLTQDENIVSVALAVQYRIADLKNYLFNVVTPVKTLQQATSSALRQVVGTMSLDDVLTTGRVELRNKAAAQINKTLALYKTGLIITDINLQPAKPPEAVTPAFDDAINAREDEQRYINQAEAYARKVTSTAAGQVARIQQQADAYKQAVVLHAQGNVARYLALLNPYKASRNVTRERLYLDTVASVLAKTTNILVDTSGSNVLYLPLDQILKKSLNHNKAASDASNDEPEQTTTAQSQTQNFESPLSTYGEPRKGYSTNGGQS